MPYDVTLGGVSFVSYEQDFNETIGADYEVVGRAVMPGPPRPFSFYNINIPIHGAQEEADPATVGMTQRSQIRALIQNDEARYQGLQFTTTFDPLLNGWIVIGTATIAYNGVGAPIGEFALAIQQAAVIPAQQALQVHRLLMADRRLTTTPLDTRRTVYRPAVNRYAVDRHYLPVGATDIKGQVDPIIPEAKPYKTLWGDGVYLENRVHGEHVLFDVPFDDVGKGDVRVYDRRGAGDPKKFLLAGDFAPESYGWARVFGAGQPLTRDDVPVLDNGRCRVRRVDGSTFAIEEAGKDGYTESARVSLGYADTRRPFLKQWTPDRAEIVFTVEGKDSRGEAHLILQRGWSGPAFDVYHYVRKTPVTVEGDAYVDEEGAWSHVHVGMADEALFATSAQKLLAVI